MRFWDSSAIVPLLTPERQTPACKTLVEEDSDMHVWVFTVTEVLSALHRKIREGNLSPSNFQKVRESLFAMEKKWSEVVQIEMTRQRAHRLLAVHSLRSGDALQLAAALIAFEDHPEGEGFVTFDENLADAARREGFFVLPSK